MRTKNEEKAKETLTWSRKDEKKAKLKKSTWRKK